MRRAELTECDDTVLLARAHGGDLDAFGELVRRHVPAALRVAAVICGSTQEADDVVQDALVTIHRRLGTYRGDGSVRSWLLRVVANHAKNHLRSRDRRRRRDERHARLLVRSAEGADESVGRRLEHEQLADALARLSAHDREVLGCRFVAGLGERETAEVLSIAVGTVKSRTSRALARLAGELATDERADDRSEAGP
jgi:RNA polymerase sigma-70 factor (ECF subfamily)